MTLRIEVTDLETGESSSAVIATGDYFVVTANPCFVEGIQIYPLKGTHILTIKKHNPQPIPEKFKAESQDWESAFFPIGTGGRQAQNKVVPNRKERKSGWSRSEVRANDLLEGRHFRPLGIQTRGSRGSAQRRIRP